MSVFSSLSMFFLSFTPLWVSVLFLDIKSIIENETPLYTEWTSICIIVVLSLLSVIILSYLPDSGIEPRSPSLQTDALPSEPPPIYVNYVSILCKR